MRKVKPEQIDVLCSGCGRVLQETDEGAFCYTCQFQLGPVLMKAVVVTGNYQLMLIGNVTYSCAQVHRAGDWLMLHRPEDLQEVQIRLSEVVMAREMP